MEEEFARFRLVFMVHGSSQMTGGYPKVLLMELNFAT
jgi:hypothetical protein